MANGQQGVKRPSAPNSRPRKRQKTTPRPSSRPSSPLHPIPTSPNARTTTQQTIDFQPLQGLHFERAIAPLPNTAFEIFQLFCPLELVDQWVEYTNQRPFWVAKVRGQAHHAIGPSRREARQNDWKPTTPHEIYVFFGILIYMSVHQEPSIEDY